MLSVSSPGVAARLAAARCIERDGALLGRELDGELVAPVLAKLLEVAALAGRGQDRGVGCGHGLVLRCDLPDSRARACAPRRTILELFRTTHHGVGHLRMERLTAALRLPWCPALAGGLGLAAAKLGAAGRA